MIIRKIFLDFDKEEQWLNEMASKGLSLVKYTFWKYEFEETLKDKYIYRIQLLDHDPNNSQSRDYLEFMNETGVEYLGNHWKWVYFRKQNSEDGFELYSDNKSKKAHYKKILSLLISVMLLNLFAGISNLCIGVGTFSINKVAIANLLLPIVNLTIAAMIVPIIISIYTKFKLLDQDINLFE